MTITNSTAPFFKKIISFFTLFLQFLHFFSLYLKHKVTTMSLYFERQKNVLVRFFMMKRGRYNRPFMHIGAMVVLFIGVIVAPFLADRYPVFSNNTEAKLALAQAKEETIALDKDVFATEISEKPRDKVEVYTVQKGDTISTIAKKYGISTDTIRWANGIIGDSLTVGDELKIPPVTGLIHKVVKGDTVYSIAKKYDSNPQAIVDFPFNDFANPQTFALVEGQTLVVPDGVKPNERVTTPRQQVFIAKGPVSISAFGFTWPLRGGISQFAAWYHMALDITSPVGTPIVAGQDGTVVRVSVGTWDSGYGTNIEVDGGNGYMSHYAHMSGVNVSVGQQVSAGKTVIGWVGLTGRTTGAHLHFEVRKSGVLVNPLAYLQ